MGTTIVSVHFTPQAVYVAHVGDSRVYRYRKGQLTQLTEDHSLLNDYLKARKLTQEEIDAFPAKNVIVRALGMKDSVQVDLSRNAPEDGDIYLLCSDGLSGMATDQEMAEILAQNSDLQAACDALIARANKNGGNDNVTCILAQYWGS
jgi:protein phosphatase